MNSEEIIQEIESLKKLVVATSKTVLTTDEAASYMGISKSKLYKLTNNKEIPYYRPTGGMCYFNRSELERWLQRRKIQSNEGLEVEAATYSVISRLIKNKKDK